MQFEENERNFVYWVMKYYPEVWQRVVKERKDLGMGQWQAIAAAVITAAGNEYSARQNRSYQLKLATLKANADKVQQGVPVNTASPAAQAIVQAQPSATFFDMNKYYIMGGAAALLIVVALVRSK